MADTALQSKNAEISDDCFYSGYEETVRSLNSIGNLTTNGTTVRVTGPKKPNSNQFANCMESLKPLLQKHLNSFCYTVYDGECSMDGFYQPKLPSGRNGHFIGSAMYKYPWYFLQMPQTATIKEFKVKAQDICAMSYDDVLDYNSNLNITVKRDQNVKYYCFLSSYIATLLECKMRRKMHTVIIISDVVPL